MRIVRKNSEIRQHDVQEPEGKKWKKGHSRMDAKLQCTKELVRKADNFMIIENKNGQNQKEMKKETKRTRRKGTSLEINENSNICTTGVHKEVNQSKERKQIVKSITQKIILK